MTVTNKLECSDLFRKDGSTEYTPIVKVSGSTKSPFWPPEDLIVLQIDSSKKVECSGEDLIKAIKNAMNC